MSYTNKAYHKFIDHQFLQARTSKTFGKQKWILFCEEMLQLGFQIRLYEARETVSKYVTVVNNGREYKVRFSNHRPIYGRQVARDCDFFVGVTNFGCYTTDDAIIAVKQYFGLQL